jgi:hypothetical protein
MQVLLLLMRIGVLVLSIFGAAGAGILGFKWRSDAQMVREKIETHRPQLQMVKDMDSAGLVSISAAEKAELEENVRKLNRLLAAIPFLILGIGMGLLGGVVSMLGRTTSGAGLLLLGGVGPATFTPLSLVFAFPLVLAGLLAAATSLVAFLTGAWSGQQDEDGPRGRERYRPSRRGRD